ncbi:hypothetical protein N7507_007077 [Penicillium longicatenatum]|nr:hypothetical protein N7507_007077 [Penicillium longicatenatum]
MVETWKQIPHNLSVLQGAQPGYTIHLFSLEPLVIYVEGFVNEKEAQHLISLADENFQPSEIWSNNGTVGTIAPHIRDSQWASPTRDATVRRVEKRAAEFQGYGRAGFLEPLKVLKYELGGHYNHHYDTFPHREARTSMEGNRFSTFFVYLQANCTGGGTNFPRLSPPKDDRWCQFVDCDEPYEAGVTFRPIPGNAIYWHNLRPSDRTPHPDLLHSGLPVTSGVKVGLNIWTWTPEDW